MTSDKEPVTFRPTKRMLREIRSYAEREALSQSDAIRSLVRRGLDHAQFEEFADELGAMDEQLDEIERLVRQESEGFADRIFGREDRD